VPVAAPAREESLRGAERDALACGEVAGGEHRGRVLRSRCGRAVRRSGPVGEGRRLRRGRGARDVGAPVAVQRDRSGVKGAHGERTLSSTPHAHSERPRARVTPARIALSRPGVSACRCASHISAHDGASVRRAKTPGYPASRRKVHG
jgi:hypothetical protein